MADGSYIKALEMVAVARELQIARNMERFASTLYLRQMTVINEYRKKRGLEPLPIHPDAYAGLGLLNSGPHAPG